MTPTMTMNTDYIVGSEIERVERMKKEEEKEGEERGGRLTTKILSTIALHMAVIKPFSPSKISKSTKIFLPVRRDAVVECSLVLVPVLLESW
mmetsp:Transcript_2780/g.4277  ORF Transcript_2780/g.4277 Transcript_2780/m.4277 type:complete len:92 (+) Transcript_2780:124-399(+)